MSLYVLAQNIIKLFYKIFKKVVAIDFEHAIIRKSKANFYSISSNLSINQSIKKRVKYEY